MYRDANEVGHGFLYRDGAITTIDHPLASSDSWAQDLNDRGQIVGFYERGASGSPIPASGTPGPRSSFSARWQMWGLRGQVD